MLSDRQEAGRILAARLREFRDQPDVIVLGLTRGGVPVAFEVAASLGAPLDVVVVRKIGAPGQPELAVGAIAPEGIRVLNPEVVHYHGLSPELLDAAEKPEREELRRRERLYRRGRPYPDLHGKRVILVDDGLATGATMRAAIEWVKLRGAAGIIVAAPVASREACDLIMAEATPLLLCHHIAPEPFWAVGVWYRNFPQVSDDEVVRFLSLAEGVRSASPEAPSHPV
ncbi:MAG: hypothetical protein RL417_2265 [Pseudomonadota bacterium]|jgi:predicted phosphoribosyltransferase